jgi:hypothetical protein
VFLEIFSLVESRISGLSYRSEKNQLPIADRQSKMCFRVKLRRPYNEQGPRSPGSRIWRHEQLDCRLLAMGVSIILISMGFETRWQDLLHICCGDIPTLEHLLVLRSLILYVRSLLYCSRTCLQKLPQGQFLGSLIKNQDGILSFALELTHLLIRICHLNFSPT